MDNCTNDFNYSEAQEAFVTTIEDMVASNIVMQAKKIRSVLKCIAYYDELRIVVDRARVGFDFDAIASDALVKTATGWTFKLPKSNKQIVALTLAIFIEVDTGRLDFLDFISKFFSANTASKSFDMFCEMVIRPFKFSFLKMLSDLEESSDDVVAVREREIDFVSQGLAKQTAMYVAKMREGVKLSGVNEELTNDLLLMLEGLDAALTSGDVLMIKAIWAGLMRNLNILGLCSREVEEMKKLLKMFLLTD